MVVEFKPDLLMTETISKFPIKKLENYTNRNIRSFLTLTSKDKLQIKHNYHPENTSII